MKDSAIAFSCRLADSSNTEQSPYPKLCTEVDCEDATYGTEASTCGNPPKCPIV